MTSVQNIWGALIWDDLDRGSTIKDYSDHGTSKDINLLSKDLSFDKRIHRVPLMHHDWSNLGSLILIEMIPKQRTFRHHGKSIIHKLYGKNWGLFIRPEAARINILIDWPLKLRVLGSRGEPHYVEDLPVHHVSSCSQSNPNSKWPLFAIQHSQFF